MAKRPQAAPAAPPHAPRGGHGGGVPSVRLLYGEEDYLLEEALRALVDEALEGADRTLNLDVLNAAETDARDIVARASSFPMTGERRVVVVREAERLGAGDLEILAAYCEAPSPSSCLVLTAVKPDMRRNPFAALRKRGEAVEFARVYEEKLPAWIAAHARGRGLTISMEGAALLASSAGSSLREIAGEIEKISLYIGTRKEISPADVAAVVGMSREYNPFALQEAIGRRDAARALTILEEILNSGGAVPLIIATLTNFYLALLKLHDCRKRGLPLQEDASRARVPPMFLGRYREALAHHTTAACSRALLLLAEADRDTKSGNAGPREVLEALALRLCGADGDSPALKP